MLCLNVELQKSVPQHLYVVAELADIYSLPRADRRAKHRVKLAIYFLNGCPLVQPITHSLQMLHVENKLQLRLLQEFELLYFFRSEFVKTVQILRA